MSLLILLKSKNVEDRITLNWRFAVITWPPVIPTIHFHLPHVSFLLSIYLEAMKEFSSLAILLRLSFRHLPFFNRLSCSFDNCPDFVIYFFRQETFSNIAPLPPHPTPLSYYPLSFVPINHDLGCLKCLFHNSVLLRINFFF